MFFSDNYTNILLLWALSSNFQMLIYVLFTTFSPNAMYMYMHSAHSFGVKYFLRENNFFSCVVRTYFMTGRKKLFSSFSFFIFQVSGQILVSGLRIFSGIRSQDIFWSLGLIYF
jgi:hypothetical protein